MDITFKNDKLKKIFNSKKELIRKFGNENAKFIMLRMAVLSAANCLDDVPIDKPDRCHQLKGDRKGDFAVDIKQPFRLIFRPNHDPVPKKDDGGIDLKNVTAIKILEVRDYH
ncbi:MAG: system killer suppression protein [Candidatus Lokiarchaeota archaeon]|nr:system killer suppression protein [Candidatus Lokiarchaeota archaeon]